MIRNKRLGCIDKNLYHPTARNACHSFAVNYPRQQHLELFSDISLTHYFKQPYQISYIEISELHTQLIGSSIRVPAIINTTELFNSQIIGNLLYDSISVDHTWQKMYTSHGNVIQEHTLDFLIIEFYLGNRWVRMDGIVFPYCTDVETDVKVRIKNGARYAKLVNINFTTTSPYYSLPVNNIPQLNPQEELVLSLTFSNPTATVIRDILRYSYAVYI